MLTKYYTDCLVVTITTIQCNSQFEKKKKKVGKAFSRVWTIQFNENYNFDKFDDFSLFA